jgi:hypothetical protein
VAILGADLKIQAVHSQQGVKFLTSYRKESVDAKKEGKLDEQEANQLPGPSPSSFRAGPWIPLMPLYGYIPFFDVIAWQDPSILVHLGFITSGLAGIILCAATMKPNWTKRARCVPTSTLCQPVGAYCLPISHPCCVFLA